MLMVAFKSSVVAADALAVICYDRFIATIQ
jgi:hypothetical protein